MYFKYMEEREGAHAMVEHGHCWCCRCSPERREKGRRLGRRLGAARWRSSREIRPLRSTRPDLGAMLWWCAGLSVVRL